MISWDWCFVGLMEYWSWVVPELAQICLHYKGVARTSQLSKMENFAIIINSLKPLNIIAKFFSMFNVYRGSRPYVCFTCFCRKIYSKVATFHWDNHLKNSTFRATSSGVNMRWNNSFWYKICVNVMSMYCYWFKSCFVCSKCLSLHAQFKF